MVCLLIYRLTIFSRNRLLKTFVVDSFSWDFGVLVHVGAVVTSDEDSLEERILDKAE